MSRGGRDEEEGVYSEQIIGKLKKQKFF